jgi:hypothetical protein
MFCPKCGTVNPDDGKFCRSCGVSLDAVSAALGGVSVSVATPGRRSRGDRIERRTDPTEILSDGVRSIVFGVGFLIISAALFMTNVAGGRAWWWAMLFPAFSFLAKGISDYVKSSKMEKSAASYVQPAHHTPQFDQTPVNPGLPPSMTDYVPAAESRYKTGDLAPPSVTDSTTRHLEVNSEGETMTLPKKPV